jgi:hypothetical protein
VCATVTLAAQSPVDPLRVKAAFFYRFAEFVDWPQPAASRPSIELCVLEPNPFDGDLTRIVDGQRLRGRPFAVRELRRGQPVDGCDELFFPASSRRYARPLLRALGERPVLTVGDYDGFLDDGGLIALRIAEGRVRFDIDRQRAERAGLRLDPQLLRLALTVR